MPTTILPAVRLRSPRLPVGLVAIIAAAAVLLAGIAGYAAAGGFTSSTPAGQDVSDRVMRAWATRDPAAISATYAPALTFLLEYPERPATDVLTSRSQLTNLIEAVSGINTYRQIGPVAYYKAADGDVYVAGLVEVKGPGHPDGTPVVGFYRVHGGKVVKQIFLDAEQY